MSQPLFPSRQSHRATLSQLKLLYGVRLPDDQRTSVTVVHITQVEVERHVVQAEDEEQANTPALYKVIEDHIYATYHGHVYKWAGNRFEKATEEEQRRYDEANPVVADDVEKYPGGWSKRNFGEASSDYRFSIDVGGLFGVDVTNALTDQGGDSMVSIDVRHAGKP